MPKIYGTKRFYSDNCCAAKNRPNSDDRLDEQFQAHKLREFLTQELADAGNFASINAFNLKSERTGYCFKQKQPYLLHNDAKKMSNSFLAAQKTHIDITLNVTNTTRDKKLNEFQTTLLFNKIWRALNNLGNSHYIQMQHEGSFLLGIGFNPKRKTGKFYLGSPFAKQLVTNPISDYNLVNKSIDTPSTLIKFALGSVFSFIGGACRTCGSQGACRCTRRTGCCILGTACCLCITTFAVMQCMSGQGNVDLPNPDDCGNCGGDDCGQCQNHGDNNCDPCHHDLAGGGAHNQGDFCTSCMLGYDAANNNTVGMMIDYQMLGGQQPNPFGVATGLFVENVTDPRLGPGDTLAFSSGGYISNDRGGSTSSLVENDTQAHSQQQPAFQAAPSSETQLKFISKLLTDSVDSQGFDLQHMHINEAPENLSDYIEKAQNMYSQGKINIRQVHEIPNEFNTRTRTQKHLLAGVCRTRRIIRDNPFYSFWKKGVQPPSSVFTLQKNDQGKEPSLNGSANQVGNNPYNRDGAAASASSAASGYDSHYQPPGPTAPPYDVDDRWDAKRAYIPARRI